MDNGQSYDCASSGRKALWRRRAVLGLGGGLAAFLVNRIVPAAAQDGSPSAGGPAASVWLREAGGMMTDAPEP
jgi:hypothetical protein